MIIHSKLLLGINQFSIFDYDFFGLNEIVHVLLKSLYYHSNQ
jgi:hypothetical protein